MTCNIPRLCCQVHPFLLCGECLSLFCEACWTGDISHVNKGHTFDKILYCPKVKKNIGNEAYVKYGDYNRAFVQLNELRAEYQVEYVLLAI